MRWLLIHPGPNFSVADVYNGWSEALRGLGEEVMEYNLDARLQWYDSALIGEEQADPDGDGRRPVRKALTTGQAIELAADGILGACYRWWPHVVLAVSAFFTTPFVLEVMRSRGHKIVMLFTEAPYQQAQQLEMAKYAHVSLVNDPVGLEEYRAVSPAAEYMPHSYRPSVHYPAVPGTAPEYDLAFVGTGFPSRIEFFGRMDLAGLRVALGGFWGALPEGSPLRRHLLNRDDGGDVCVDNAETAALYRRSACGLNLYRQEAEPDWDQQAWAMGPREVEMAASGLFFVRDPRGEGDEVLSMLPAFTTPQQAGDLIRWYAAHPADRERRTAAARAAIADRTFENAAKRLLRLLDQ